MIPSYRRRFNNSWSPAAYRRFLDILSRECGEPPPFRHSETPCFFPGDLIGRIGDLVDLKPSGQLLLSPLRPLLDLVQTGQKVLSRRVKRTDHEDTSFIE